MKKLISLLSLTLLLQFQLNAKNEKNKIDLHNIQREETHKTKEDYEKKQDLLLAPKSKDNKNTKKDEDKISFDGNVDFNKENKEVEGVKVNIGTKF